MLHLLRLNILRAGIVTQLLLTGQLEAKLISTVKSAVAMLMITNVSMIVICVRMKILTISQNQNLW